jgi:hypothetical protein
MALGSSARLLNHPVIEPRTGRFYKWASIVMDLNVNQIILATYWDWKASPLILNVQILTIFLPTARTTTPPFAISVPSKRKINYGIVQLTGCFFKHFECKKTNKKQWTVQIQIMKNFSSLILRKAPYNNNLEKVFLAV